MGQESPTGRIFSAEILLTWSNRSTNLVATLSIILMHGRHRCLSSRRRSFATERRWQSICLRPILGHFLIQSVVLGRQSNEGWVATLGAVEAGGQTFNVRRLDLNGMAGFFIEQSREDFDAIKAVIAQNARERGWLIFATHDVADSPTRFGCTASLFEKIVRCAIASGAVVLPVSQALDAVVSAGELSRLNRAIELRAEA